MVMQVGFHLKGIETDFRRKDTVRYMRTVQHRNHLRGSSLTPEEHTLSIPGW